MSAPQAFGLGGADGRLPHHGLGEVAQLASYLFFCGVSVPGLDIHKEGMDLVLLVVWALLRRQEEPEQVSPKVRAPPQKKKESVVCSQSSLKQEVSRALVAKRVSSNLGCCFMSSSGAILRG